MGTHLLVSASQVVGYIRAGEPTFPVLLSRSEVSGIELTMSKIPRKPSAVIFDLDGVLLDSEPLYSEATRRVVERFGYGFDGAIRSEAMGRSSRAGAQYVIEKLNLPLELDDYIAERRRYLVQLLPGTPAISGARSWVETLQGVGVPLAVATSSSRKLCEIKWLLHPWVSKICPIVCGDDRQVVSSKPAPDIYLVAAERLGCRPADCLVFEDSPAGIEAAKSAGMQVVALENSGLPAEIASRADWKAQGFSELSLESLGL